MENKTDNIDSEETVSEISLNEKVEKIEKRFDNYMKIEVDHYEEYKFFEKRTMNFQSEFPYDRMNWLGKLIMWFICKKRK